MYAKFQCHPRYGFWEEFLLIFFENLPVIWPRQPIKLSDLNKSHKKWGGLLNKYIWGKKKSNISKVTAEIVNFHFSHYKSMGTAICEIWNELESQLQRRSRFISDDGGRFDWYTMSSPMSPRLRWAKHSNFKMPRFLSPRFSIICHSRLPPNVLDSFFEGSQLFFFFLFTLNHWVWLLVRTA